MLLLPSLSKGYKFASAFAHFAHPNYLPTHLVNRTLPIPTTDANRRRRARVIQRIRDVLGDEVGALGKARGPDGAALVDCEVVEREVWGRGLLGGRAMRDRGTTKWDEGDSKSERR